MLRSLRIPFIIAVATACAVDQPLPPPNNPVTADKLCVADDDCGDERICHISIGGGACADDCRTHGADAHSYCAGLVDGYVCQTDLGVCAPSCTATIGGQSGDPLCAALGRDLVCQASGQCLYSPPSQTAFIRVFNATSDKQVELSLGGLGTVVPAVAPGQLSSEVGVASGGRELTVTSGTDILVTGSKVLQPGKRYFVVVHPLLGSGHQAAFVDAEGPGSPAADNPWITYRHFVPGMPAQDVAFNGTAVLKDIGFRVESDAVQVAPGSGSFAVGPAPGKAATMSGAASLVVDHTYLTVTWVGDGVLPETTIMGREEGVVARFSPAGVRLVNATYDNVSSLTATADGATIADNLQRLTTSPASGYALIAPGSHQLIVRSGVTAVLNVNADLVANRHYSMLIGGSKSLVATPSVALFGRFVSDDALVMPAPDKLAIRAAHFAAASGQSDKTLDVAAGAATVTSLLAFGEVQSAFAEVPLAATLPITATLMTVPAVMKSFPITTARAVTLLVVGSSTASTPDLWLLDDRGDNKVAD